MLTCLLPFYSFSIFEVFGVDKWFHTSQIENVSFFVIENVEFYTWIRKGRITNFEIKPLCVASSICIRSQKQVILICRYFDNKV